MRRALWRSTIGPSLPAATARPVTPPHLQLLPQRQDLELERDTRTRRCSQGQDETRTPRSSPSVSIRGRNIDDRHKTGLSARTGVRRSEIVDCATIVTLKLHELSRRGIVRRSRATRASYMPEHRDDDPVEANEPLDRFGQTTLQGMAAAWHKTADALHETERRYRELVEHSLGLMCTHDLTGTILSVNAAAATSLGYRPEQGIGYNLRDFLSPETRHLFDGYLQRIQDTGQDVGVMRVIVRNGESRFWMYRNVLSRDQGGTPYVLGHAIDITERIAAERKLRDSDEALRAAHAALETRVQERTHCARACQRTPPGRNQRTPPRRRIAPARAHRTARHARLPGRLFRPARTDPHLR